MSGSELGWLSEELASFTWPFKNWSESIISRNGKSPYLAFDSLVLALCKFTNFFGFSVHPSVGKSLRIGKPFFMDMCQLSLDRNWIPMMSTWSIRIVKVVRNYTQQINTHSFCLRSLRPTFWVSLCQLNLKFHLLLKSIGYINQLYFCWTLFYCWLHDLSTG